MKKYRGAKSYTKEFVEQIAKNSLSKREMIVGLSLPTSGTYGYRVLNHFLELYAIDVSHFEGRERARNSNIKNATPLDEILAGKHPTYSTGSLKARMIKAGMLLWQCAECELTEWRGRPIPLDLDHINGKSWDHNRENIRLLCRNCHAQTETFCGKNRPKVKSKKRIAHEEGVQSRKDTFRQKQLDLVPKVKSSGIDFKKHGWVSEVAPIIGQLPQKVNVWMKKYMPEFYEVECFRRK